MTKFYVFFFLLISVASCSKIEPKKTWTVKYQLLNVGNAIPTYRVTYILRNGSTKTEGPINSYNWESENLAEFEDGTPVFLEIEIISGKGQYELIILRNGAFHEKEIMPQNETHYKLESEI